MNTDLTVLISSLNLAVFEQGEDQLFECITPLAPWLLDFIPSLSEPHVRVNLARSTSFLELFIEDVAEHWRSGSSDVLESGDWVEALNNGSDIPLCARALQVNNRRYVVIESIAERYGEIQRVHQAARDTMLKRDKLFSEVKERNQLIRRREEEISVRLLSATNMRDQETGAHVRRIGLYSAAIAEAMGWAEQKVVDIRVAAPMHDIGKIGIPDSILLKPGKLTESEFLVMQQHASIGADLLSGSEVPLLEMAREIALSHHERWDGDGYPNRWVADQTPQSARIVAVCDVYDALSNKRVYKPAFGEQETVTMMQEQSGKHFDPEVLKCFLDMLPTIHELREQVSDSQIEIENFDPMTGTFG